MGEREEYLSQREQIHPLEYQPVFNRSERQVTGWTSSDGVDTSNLPAGRVDRRGIGSGLVRNTIEELEQLKESIREKIEEKESEFRRESIPIDEDYREEIARAKEALGLSGRELTLADYREALLNHETAAGDFLLSYIENQIEDVNGNIEWETYGELFELEQELALLDDYIAQLLYPVLSFETNNEEDWLELLEEAEKEWNDNRITTIRYYQDKKDDYKQSLITRPENIPFVRGQLHDAEKDQDRYRHEYKQVENALRTVKQKTGEVRALVRDIDTVESIELPEGEVLAGATSLTESEQEELETLTNMRLMMKLSVDNHNKEKHHFKNSLRNTYSYSKQQRLIDETASHHNIFNEHTLSTLHYMRSYQDNVNSLTNELFDEIAVGMEENEKEKRNKAYELFMLNHATSSIREHKIEEMRQKQIARLGFTLASQRIEELREG